ncbi:MAG TPA: YoaK family protein [Pseudonocardiaceae bacterium]
MTSKVAPTTRWRQVLLVLLAVNSGATDAVGFVALGGAFTSVMTGNMVLIGLSAAKSDGAVALRSALAIVLFMAGCVVGSRVAGQPAEGDPLWPRQVSRALWVELAAFAVYAVGWWLSGSHPAGNVQLVLLSANAVALGVQSSAVLRFGVSGLSTTYMTGTLTTMMAALAAGRHPRKVLPSAEIIAGLIVGAAAATLLAIYVPVVAPLLQLGLVLVVLVTASTRSATVEAGPQPT